MGFVNSFVSYLLLMIIFVIVGGVAIFMGITLRRSADAKGDIPVAEKTNTEA